MQGIDHIKEQNAVLDLASLFYRNWSQDQPVSTCSCLYVKRAPTAQPHSWARTRVGLPTGGLLLELPLMQGPSLVWGVYKASVCEEK